MPEPIHRCFYSLVLAAVHWVLVGVVMLPKANAQTAPGVHMQIDTPQCAAQDVADAFYIQVLNDPQVYRVDVSKALRYTNVRRLQELYGVDISDLPTRQRLGCPKQPFRLESERFLRGVFGGDFTLPLSDGGSVAISWAPASGASTSYEDSSAACAFAPGHLLHCMVQRPKYLYNEPGKEVPMLWVGSFGLDPAIGVDGVVSGPAGYCQMTVPLGEFCEVSYRTDLGVSMIFNFPQGDDALKVLADLADISSAVRARLALRALQ